MAGRVKKNDLRFPVNFAKSIDDFTRPINSKENYLKDVHNGEVRRELTIASRLGASAYQDQVATALTNPIRSLHHYTKRDGTRKILAYHRDPASQDIVADDSYDGDFAHTIHSWGVTDPTDDGYIRTAQWKDCAIYSGINVNTRCFNDGEVDNRSVALGVNEDFEPTLLGVSTANPFVVPTPVDVAGYNLAQGVWSYRFTADVYHGDIFLGETHPLHLSLGANIGELGKTHWDKRRREYWQINADQTAAGNVGRVRIQKGWVGTLSAIPINAKYINVYRTAVPLPTGTGVAAAQNRERRWDFFFAGSFEISPINDGGTPINTDIFSDDGTVALGRQISYAQTLPMPRARHLEKHKSRLWLGYVYERSETSSAEDKLHPERVYFSELDAPCDIRPLNWLPFDDAGLGVTGLHSFFGRVLMVFTVRGVWGIYGADDELAPGVPNLYKDRISRHGCIAPNSIVQTDAGVAWMSPNGPVIYDGERVYELDSRRIRTIIDSIPADRRYHVQAAYNPTEDEIILQHTYDDGDTDAELYNRYAEVYNFRSNTWMRHERRKGLASLLSVVDPDGNDFILGGREDSGITVSFPVVIQLDGDDAEPVPASGDDQKVDFWVETALEDGGRPDTEKDFSSILFRYRSPVALTVTLTCDDRAVAVSGQLPSTGAPPQDMTHLLQLPQGAWGKAISIKVAGLSDSGQIEIHPAVVYYTDERTAS